MNGRKQTMTNGSRSQGQRQIIRPGQDPITQLVTLARSLRLGEIPRLASQIEKVIQKGDQAVAAKLVKRFSRQYARQLVRPDWFISAEDNFDGEFLLGHTEDGRRFGLDREQLVRHVFISGQSGFGKSNLIEVILRQANGEEVAHDPL